MARLLEVLLLLLFLISFSECHPIGNMSFAMKFLMKYKYLLTNRATKTGIIKAIEDFQKFFSLPVTGFMDPATKNLMSKPRCGNGDRVRVISRGKRFVTGRSWSKTNLTYRFINHGEDLHPMKVEEIVAHAFTFWSRVSRLTFFKSTGASADITFLFGRNNHGDRFPFDGRGGTLAHAFFPPDGRVHFDEDETYTHGTPSGTNLLWVTVHELGHALGLYHTNVYGAVMYPYYQGYKPNMTLHSDDIKGIQSLYGLPSATQITPQNRSTPINLAATNQIGL